MFPFQAYCTGHSGRNEPSLGRKRREIASISNADTVVTSDVKEKNGTDDEEQVREMIEVSETFSFIPNTFREILLIFLQSFKFLEWYFFPTYTYFHFSLISIGKNIDTCLMTYLVCSSRPFLCVSGRQHEHFL